jgi:hypothetical protein
MSLAERRVESTGMPDWIGAKPEVIDRIDWQRVAEPRFANTHRAQP